MEMMARFRRSLAVVHRIKHIVDSSATLAAATTLPVTLVKGVDAPVLANTPEVETGAKVHGIFLNVQVSANEASGGIPNIYMAVFKNPSGNISTIDPVGTGDDPNKKAIIHQEMIMFAPTGTQGLPRTLFKGVIVIPRGMQRFGIDDELVVVLRAPSVNVKVCVQCIYKEFR